MTFIGSYAFSGCTGLQSVFLPGSVTTIGGAAFYHCNRIQISAPAGSYAEHYAKKNGIAFQGDSSVQGGDYITQITEEGTWLKYAGPGGDIVFSGGKSSVTPRLFAECATLTGITLPEGVEEICAEAFAGCTSLVRVSIPASTKKIETCVFSGCSSLTEVEIHPDNPNFRFEKGMILSVDGTILYTCVGGISGACLIPDGVKKIVDAAFSGCEKITGITIPDTVTAMGSEAFAGCASLTTLKLSAKTKKISAGLCKGCTQLHQVEFPPQLTSIGKYTFSETGLESVTLPQSLTKIDNHAFDGAYLTELTLPAAVEEVGAGAFAHCPLKRITLLGSKIKFGQKAFGEDAQPELVIAGGNIAELQPSIREAAVRSFAERYLAGERIADEVQASCLKYIKGHRKTLWMDPVCLRVILKERYLTEKDIGYYVEESAKLGNPGLTAMLLEYRSQNISQEDLDKAGKIKL